MRTATNAEVDGDRTAHQRCKALPHFIARQQSDARRFTPVDDSEVAPRGTETASTGTSCPKATVSPEAVRSNSRWRVSASSCNSGMRLTTTPNARPSPGSSRRPTLRPLWATSTVVRMSLVATPRFAALSRSTSTQPSATRPMRHAAAAEHGGSQCASRRTDWRRSSRWLVHHLCSGIAVKRARQPDEKCARRPGGSCHQPARATLGPGEDQLLGCGSPPGAG